MIIHVWFSSQPHVAMSHGVCVDVSREVLKLDGDIQKLAAGLKDAHNLLLFGRGYNYATALEAALKVRTWHMAHGTCCVMHWYALTLCICK